MFQTANISSTTISNSLILSLTTRALKRYANSIPYVIEVEIYAYNPLSEFISSIAASRDLSKYELPEGPVIEKTRKERIPWKYHKKGIDNKLTTETIYNKYLKRINKNPLNPTGNKMIKINKKKKNKNSENNLINNSLLKSVNMESKILNQTNIENQKYKNNLENINNNLMRKIMENQKEAKERKKLSIDKRTNIHKDKINSNKNIKEKNKLSTNDMFKQKKKLNSSISTKIKNLLNADIILKKENETYNIFDLSCLVIKEKNLKKCKDNLV